MRHRPTKEETRMGRLTKHTETFERANGIPQYRCRRCKRGIPCGANFWTTECGDILCRGCASDAIAEDLGQEAGHGMPDVEPGSMYPATSA